MLSRTLLLAAMGVSAIGVTSAAICENYGSSEDCNGKNDGGCSCLWRENRDPEKGGTCSKSTSCSGVGITSVIIPVVNIREPTPRPTDRSIIDIRPLTPVPPISGSECMCNKIFQPVCFDGKTYGNLCIVNCNETVAEIMKDKENHLEIVDGTCDEVTPECVCNEMYQPVCFDGATYSNTCIANCNETVVEMLKTVRPGLVKGTCQNTTVEKCPGDLTLMDCGSHCPKMCGVDPNSNTETMCILSCKPNVCQCERGVQLGADQCIVEQKDCPSAGDKCKLDDSEHPEECPISACLPESYPDNCKESTLAAWDSASVGFQCCPEQCVFRVEGNQEKCRPTSCDKNQCPPQVCASPRPGCEYGEPTVDECGCRQNCGELLCQEKCTTGYARDEMDGNSKCVPVTCDAELACKGGYQCVPVRMQCIHTPCRQFLCEPEDVILPECVCNEMYQPVCFDYTTYSNTCFANCNATVVEMLKIVRPGLVNGTCDQTMPIHTFEQVTADRKGLLEIVTAPATPAPTTAEKGEGEGDDDALQGTIEMVLKELKDLRAENSKELSEIKDLINQRGQASSCMLGRRSKRSEP